MRHKECRRDSETCREHAADHDLEAERLSFGPQSQRFGQSAGLVELDIDRLVAAEASRKIGSVMQAFIGAERNRRNNPVEQMVFALSHGLFDEFHAKGDERRGFCRNVSIRPGFIRVDNQPGVGSSATDGCDAGQVIFARELDLDEAGAAG